MNAQERLVGLSKLAGSAGALLLAIGSGSTASAVLMNYSGLSSESARGHLLYDRVFDVVKQFYLPVDLSQSERATGGSYPFYMAEKQRIRRGF